MKRLFLLAGSILLSAGLPIFGQRSSGPRSDQLLTTVDGLSNNFVVSLDIDRYGSLWIGTEEGMNRFDGVSVRSYTQASGTIPGNGLNQVVADRFSDVVWAATQRAGLSRYHYGTGQTDIFLPDGTGSHISAKEITHMEQDRNGNLWISTYLDGINRYNPSTGEFTRYNASNVEGMLDFRIHCFTLGADGKVYIGHYGEGVTILDPEKMTAVRFERTTREGPDATNLPSNIIGCVYRDPDNNIWFGTWSGLALYRPVTRDFLVFNHENAGLPVGEIFSMLVTHDRKILVSPDYQGVWTASIDSLSTHPLFTPLPEAQELSHIGIHAMCEDSFGNLWLGSYGRGVLFVNRNRQPFSRFLYPNPISDHSVTAIAFTPEGDLAVGTEGGRIDILDRKFQRKQDPRTMDTGRSILSGTVDSDGNIWVGSFFGQVLVYRPDGKLQYEVPVIEARCFLQQGNRMWIGSGNGLFLINRDDGSLIRRYSHTDKLPENYLRSLALDRYDNLWVGTFGSGIAVFDPDMEEIARFQSDLVSAGNMINALLPDRQGRMWAGTGGGLIRFSWQGSRPVEDAFAVASPLRSEFIRSLVEDENGDIWFGTNLSICHIDDEQGHVTEYSYRSNIAPGNYQNGAVALRNDGYLCFGSTEGVTGFYPDEVLQDQDLIDVHFSELSIFTAGSPEGESQTVYLCGRNEIVLNHRQNNFFVTFTADNYGLSDQTEFSYRLEGGGGKWYPTEGSNVLNFRQLPPGKYRLQVRSRLINGEWSPKTASLQIRINSPWWLSTSAKLLYGILALLLAGLGLLLYTTSLQRKNELEQQKAAARMLEDANEERLRFYTNITHELRTPLTLILSPAEDLKNDPSLSEKARVKADVLQQNANRLLDLINTLLNFRKTETHNMQNHPAYGDLSSMVEGIGRVFAEANTHKETRILMDVDKGILTEFDPDIVTSILNNLLSNAVKYTPSGSITLGLHMEGNQAEMSVTDTGYGIAEDQQQKIFERYYQVQGDHMAQGTGIGLSLVKNLVELAGWDIRVESKPGKGSTFTVTLPLTTRENEGAPEFDTLVPDPQADSKPIVVIVEDNEDIRNYVRETLEDQYTVMQAKNGEEGWAVILRTVPDLVISDIMMPVMDGIELCTKIKRNIQVSHIPVILLTAKDTLESRSEGYEAGADSYLTKPFTGSMLRSRIKNLLESRKRLADQFGSALQERKEQEVAENSFQAIDNEFVRKITELIEENISSENLDVTYLAEHLNMSASTLYRKMKALVGISANEYVRKIRMRKAAEMLASGNFNVSETAWNIGINSLIYFRQCFKEEYGCSPSEYRRRVRETP